MIYLIYFLKISSRLNGISDVNNINGKTILKQYKNYLIFFHNQLKLNTLYAYINILKLFNEIEIDKFESENKINVE